MNNIIKSIKVAIALNEQLGTFLSQIDACGISVADDVKDYADITVAVASSSMTFQALEAIANRHGIIIENRQIYKKTDSLDTPSIINTPIGDNIAKEKARKALEEMQEKKSATPVKPADED